MSCLLEMNCNYNIFMSNANHGLGIPGEECHFKDNENGIGFVWMMLGVIIIVLICVEVLFYMYASCQIRKTYLKSSHNVIPHREYPLSERRQLLKMILSRLIQEQKEEFSSRQQGSTSSLLPKDDDQQVSLASINKNSRVRDFIQSWLHYDPNFHPTNKLTSNNSCNNSSTISDTCEILIECIGDSQGLFWQIQQLQKEEQHNSVPKKKDVIKLSSSSIVPSSILTTTGSFSDHDCDDDSNTLGSEKRATQVQDEETEEEKRGYVNVRTFLCWALYSMPYSDLPQETTSENDGTIVNCVTSLSTSSACRADVDYMMDVVLAPHILRKDNQGWNEFANYYPRCMSWEPLAVWHRPLFIYMAMAILRYLSQFVFLQHQLFFPNHQGFQKFVTSNGLTYWYRPPADQTTRQAKNSTTPKTILFFHGIAPMGITAYIPFLYQTLLHSNTNNLDDEIFLFENDNIASCVTTKSKFLFSEPETVEGVQEALQKQHHNQSESTIAKKIVLVGHSFGTCPITWLLHNPTFRNKYKEQLHTVILLDPVTILLSEPDVMMNFLYFAQTNAAKLSDENHNGAETKTLHLQRKLASFAKQVKQTCIRGIASQEWGVQHYLRRHFAWYNCELNFESPEGQRQFLDIPQIVIGLSESDEIVPSAKIQKEILRIQANYSKRNNNDSDNIKLLFWKGAGHGSCAMQPDIMKQIRGILSSI